MRVFFLSLGCSLDQCPWSNASLAFITAWSTSSALQAATCAITLPVAGLIVSNVFPDFEDWNCPLMNALVGKLSEFAIALYSSWVRRSDI